MRERVKWVDVAKFLGIFAIYFGHLNIPDSLRHFVFVYHVPLFFFLSGCMSNYDKENNFGKFIIKKIKNIMIPLWIFCFVSIFITELCRPIGLVEFKGMILGIAKGNIRNTFIAGSLWFLSCLFVIELIFKLMRYLKNKILILTICIGMYLIAVKLITPMPLVLPHWIFNLDSAFYYIVYYAIGYVMYPLIVSLFKLDTLRKKVIVIISGIVSGIYTLLMIKDTVRIVYLINQVPKINIFIIVISALCLIWFNLIVAKIFENINLFNEIGKSTLFLCCNEYVINILLFDFLAMFSLSIILLRPIQVVMLVMIMFIVVIKILIPIEKMIAKNVMNFLKKLKYQTETGLEKDNFEIKKEG